ncbi:hypothetical protein OB919_04975 [Halobacteria archaeon AArc-curdl1]|uniref:Twin-arginine translocation signal domain-containing protein n=1 Tax=Natronosalvus hydrolyticus TaxID=2979988 RepID=A0AAP2Z6W1_9EURY|nr:hypothetical protein [Halobacteria archaeon AArc-curdl1]
MTDSDTDRPVRPYSKPSDASRTDLLAASRRTFLGLVGVATGASAVSASGDELAGYGEGGFGVGGFGEGGTGVAAGRTVDYYADDSGTVTGAGASNALEDWQAGEIDTPLLLDVINAWQSGNDGY